MGEPARSFGRMADFLRNTVRESSSGKSDGVLNVSMNCKACGKVLQIDEMHYYAHGDGNATCDDCEAEWSQAVAAWRNGAPGEFPSRPGRNDIFPTE